MMLILGMRRATDERTGRVVAVVRDLMLTRRE